MIRCTLYMATFSAMRFNEVIRRFADRLKTAGRPFKGILVACMRKLLTILNIMIREKQSWNRKSMLQNP